MADFLSPAERSRRMAAVRTSGTAPEQQVRRLLKELGIRYRSNARQLPGRPDLVVPDPRVAIFVHGCFWHCHTCRHGRTRPRTRRAFWLAKLAANRARDRRVQRQLRAQGWHVVTVWQCQLRDLERLGKRLGRFLARCTTEPAATD